MEYVVNETPVRTSNNFGINNIKLQDINLSNKFIPFASSNFTFTNNASKIVIGECDNINNNNNNNNCDNNNNNNSDKTNSKVTLEYGISKEFTNQVNEFKNKNILVEITSKYNKEEMIEFKLDKENSVLIDNITINSEEATKGTVVIKYISDVAENSYYHNGIIKINAKENATLTVIVLNYLGKNATNLLAIENELKENANINYIIIDIGAKTSIVNYYTNLIGKNSNNTLDTIYVKNENSILDLNYILRLNAEKTVADVNVEGALTDNAKKYFKGTLDFRKGSKKAQGNEKDNCILLSNNTVSRSLPMLLCSEEDVQGNHSSSVDKAQNKELFYIMSRGINKKDAMKLLVRARFNKILEKITNEELREDILLRIDEKLD